MPLGRTRHIPPSTGYTGRIPKTLWDVLRLAWEGGGIAVSSNYAREASREVALAASIGWISTVSLDGKHYHRVWNITAEGVAAFNNRKELGGHE